MIDGANNPIICQKTKNKVVTMVTENVTAR